jgi:preprotein translocase subunit SecE
MDLATYFKDTLEELKQVTWPQPQTTIKLTATVIAISLLVAAYVGGLDFLFTNLLTYIVK